MKDEITGKNPQSNRFIFLCEHMIYKKIISVYYIFKQDSHADSNSGSLVYHPNACLRPLSDGHMQSLPNAIKTFLQNIVGS